MSNNNRFNYKKRGNFRGRYTNRPSWSRKENSSGRCTPSTESESSFISENVPAAAKRAKDQPLISVALDIIPGPYPGWKWYFPLEGYAAGTPTVHKIKAVESHISRRSVLYSLPRCRKLCWYPIHIRALLGDPVFCDDWPMFEEDLSDRPEHTLNCLGLAMHQILSMDNESVENQNSVLGIITARIIGHGPILPLKNIRVKMYGKLVSIRGTVIRAGNPKMMCTWMTFYCASCHAQQTVKQPGGVMTSPEKCVGNGCLIRSNFVPMSESASTRIAEWQTLRVQEFKTVDQIESGRVPRSLDVEVTSDLVDSCCPGDDVTITGIVQVRAVDEYVKKGQPSMYKMYLEGISIQNQREHVAEDEFTDRDHAAIQAIKSEPDVFRLLVNSLCPLIFGRECIKAGLILSLMGGSRTTVDNNDSNRRYECHVLIIGEPGLGKSQMLKACSDVAPRGVFVCGNTSSSSGLTASASHGAQSSSDSGMSSNMSSSTGIEAGALVLADGGVCCIDEFDKMTKQHQALLEAMEQQRVSLAKAGAIRTLPARCAVVAAANPDKGVYDKSRTLKENVNLSTALLSRFDLIFILLDLPDEQLDKRVTEHVFAMKASADDRSKRNQIIDLRYSATQNQIEPRTMQERLRLKPGEQFDALPLRLMRKYIGYARKNIHPKITNDAAEELKKFYLELRRVRQGADSAPVTPRQLEALVRLTQARARVELSSVANADHARDIIDLTKISLADMYLDGIGIQSIAGSKKPLSSLSHNTKTKKFLSLLQMRSELTMRTQFTISELEELANSAGLFAQGGRFDFKGIIDKLNEQGCLLKKGPQIYQLLTLN